MLRVSVSWCLTPLDDDERQIAFVEFCDVVGTNTLLVRVWRVSFAFVATLVSSRPSDMARSPRESREETSNACES